MTVNRIISFVLYYPLLRKYKISSETTQKAIQQDAAKFLKMNSEKINESELSWLIRCLKSEYFRVIFYHRVGNNKGVLKKYKRQANSLTISPNCLIMGGYVFTIPMEQLLMPKGLVKISLSDI